MLILHEGELLHTDSSTDILEHYGVKGMKWGKRLRSAASKVASNKRVRATGRYLKDQHKAKQHETKGVKNKVDNYVQYRHDVSNMNKKYAGRKGY